MSEQGPLAAALLGALSASLVHLVWQGCLIGAFHAISRRVFLRSSPSTRHLNALGSLLALFVCFGVTLALSLARLLAAPERLLEGGAWVAGSLALPVLGFEAWVIAGWSCGVVTLAGRSALGVMGVRRLRATSMPLGESWRRTLERLAGALGVTREVELASSATIRVPLLIGWLRPLVLLPASVLARVPIDVLEAAIAHELAHIRRRDHLVALLVASAEALFFYHPVAWWLSREIRETRELACDELVVQTFGDRPGYARSLARLEAGRAGQSSLSLAASGGKLMMRIRHLVQPDTPSPVSSRGGSLVLALALLLCVALAASALAGSGELSIGWLPDEVARHRALIERSAERHGLDADLVAIVVLVESRGDPEAESSYGALGLMQVMPATAARIAALRGLAQPTREDLLDPTTNLDYGTWYLAQQARSFAPAGLDVEGVARLAAAYNAGPDRVRRHLDEGLPLSAESVRYSRTVARLWSERLDEGSSLLGKLDR